MQKYNEQKICFIICTNAEQYMQECLLYLSLLKVPDGFETEILTIQDAKSMAAGYNEGMHASDAKYKVYLHQDTFIKESSFIEKLVEIFRSDNQIGMVGMLGAEHLSKDGVMWHENRCGDFYRLEEMIQNGLETVEQLESGLREVEVLDGFLIATQYDIPWREDILKEWDFYDVSQCIEFRRAGYKIVIPAQNPSWTIHAGYVPGLWNYNKNREIILKEYPEIKTRDEYLRILFYHSNMIQILGIPYSLISLGHNVTVSNYKVMLDTFLEQDVEKVEEELEEGNYDLVVTYDFSFGVAKACENMHVKYFSWVYDSPLLELYSDYAKSPYNYFGLFDKKQYSRMKEFGLKNLYHVPLCAEVDVFGSTNITKKDEKQYATDVAFVGRLYDHRGYKGLFGEGSEKLKKEFDEIAASCNCYWNEDITIFDKASEELIEYITGKLSQDVWETYSMSKRFYCESMKLDDAMSWKE